MNAPNVSYTVSSPTSLTVNVGGTGGAAVVTRWRSLPDATNDRTGPSRTGDGDLEFTGLPVNGSILLSVFCVDPLGGYSLPYSLPASLVQADTLSGAVGRLWGLVPALSSSCGPVFSQEAPENLSGEKLELPWTILTYDRTTQEFTTEGIYYETTRLEFACYAVGDQKAEDALAAVSTYLDWQALPFANPRLVRTVMVDPVDYTVESTFMRNRTGQVVWKGCRSYLVTVERQHPRWKPYLE